MLRGVTSGAGAEDLGGGGGPKGTLCAGPLGTEGTDGVCGVVLGLARRAAEASANDCRLTFSLFSFLGGGARSSTNRPNHSSVPGYEIGPMLRVTRAMHSISCAGGSTSLLVLFAPFFGFSEAGVDGRSGFAGSVESSREAVTSIGLSGP